MKAQIGLWTAAAVLGTVMFVTASAAEDEAASGDAISAHVSFTDEDCATCHGGDDASVPTVTHATLEKSIHSGLSCTDCHQGVDDLPHAEGLPKVVCGSCHESETDTYTHHGRGVRGVTEDLPTCAGCHGTHDILPSSDRDSRVHPLHMAATCGTCHEDLDLAKKHDILLKKPVTLYEASVHGRATKGGVYVAATCTDCHSTEGTAHRILGAGDRESSINHFNIPKTCGQCHKGIEQDYWEGIHGQLAARGQTDTPVCTTCHGEHGILRTDDPRANVSPILVAQATCAPCHESARLNEKYGIPSGRLASFVDSYHGLKSKAGDPTVANCASCHGGHRILPSTDPSSTIFPENLQTTCGTCHPGISAALAATKIHETSTGHEAGLPGLIAKIYIVLIIGVIGGMAGYVAIDYRRKFRDMLRLPQVRRMDANAIFQHSILTVSFIALVISGFALRYSDAWLFQKLFGWDGGFGVRGIMHRAAAVVFVLGCLWHLLYLRTKNGQVFWKGMLPSIKRDGGELLHMVLYNLEKKDEPPRFGRFTYVEKAEYWALVWGTVVMVITGFFLWFDNLASQVFPKGFLDVMLVIHFYEAWLASLAIAVWHLYMVLFRPGVYPGNPAWITGKMPRHLYEEEHPEDHAVKEAAPEDDLVYPRENGESGSREASREDRLEIHS